MDFYGDVKEINHASEYILTVKTSKNVLNIFRKKKTPTLGHSAKNNAEVL